MADDEQRAGPVLLGISAATIYDPPVGGAILRMININNETGILRTFGISIGTDGSGKRILGPSCQIQPNSAIQWTGFIPLTDVDVVQAFADLAGAITVTMGLIENPA